MIIKRYITFFVCLLAAFPQIFAQKSEMERLKADYPKTAKRFPVDKQSATYVFAIDFSSSMRELEPVVKDNLNIFINSLPDGDKITLIKEGSTPNTDFIYLPNAKITPQSRRAIITSLADVHFIENSSDGYKLTEKIIEAIDQTGDNDLIYIFIFTDFEYYTQANAYDKNKCDWDKLKRKYSGIVKGKKIIKTGLELVSGGLKPGAIFKADLDSVFNIVRYYKIVDGSSLANWFRDTRANILRDRLKFIVEKKIEEELACCEFYLKPAEYPEPECWIECKDCELIKSYTLLGPEDLKHASRPLIEWPFADNSVKKAEILLNFNTDFNHPKGYNEIEKLIQDTQKKTVPIIVTKPDAYIAWWVALLIIVFILGVLSCIFYTCFIAKKTFSNLRVYAEWNSNNRIETKSQNFSSVPKISIGCQYNGGENTSSFIIPDTGKQFEIYIRHRCPCRLWIKPGVYIKGIKGNNITYIITGVKVKKTLNAGTTDFISSIKKFNGLSVEFEDNNIQFSVKIR